MPSSGRQGFRRLVPYVLRHKRRLAIGLCLVPVYTATQLTIPQVVGSALEELEALGTGRAGESLPVPDFLLGVLLLLVGLWAIYGVLRCLARYLLIGLSRVIEEEMRNDFFAHLQRLPQSFFDRSRIGDLIARSTQDIELLRFMIGPALFFGLASSILLPAAVVLVCMISWKLGAAVGLCFLVVGTRIIRVFPRLSDLSRRVQDAQGDIGARAQESFTGVRVLQAFGREESETRGFHGTATVALDAQIDMAWARGQLHALFGLSEHLGLFALVTVGVLEGLAISAIFKGLLYAQLLVWPVLVIGWVLQTWHRAKAAADRLDEVFEVEREDAGGEAPAELEPALAARGLSFSYAESRTPALVDLSFALPAYGTLGLVGPIGGGKTTLVSLLTRLYEPPRGQLFLGGVDVRDLPLAELRSRVSVAPQDPFLFGDTLENNLRFASEAIDDARLERAIDDAGLRPDLADLPEGIEQLVGERGVTLSGGQKQRSSLARALAGKRSVLVLDDTLSAVDSETERHILGRLESRLQKHTTILIAHRLEAVRNADLILVLEQGRAIEQGTHAELVSSGGWYARTWAHQVGGARS